VFEFENKFEEVEKSIFEVEVSQNYVYMH